MKLSKYLLILAVMIALLCTNGGDEISGTISETDVGIIGQIVNSNGTPVSDVSMVAHLIDSIDKVLPVDTVLTDKSGGYVFKGLSSGTYRIEGTKDIDSLEYVALSEEFEYDSLVLGDSLLNLGIDTLFSPGAIKGVVLSPEANHLGIDVYIPGTSFIAKSDDDGNFLISGIPQGDNYSLVFSALGYVTEFVDSIKVEVEDTVVLPDTVKLKYDPNQTPPAPQGVKGVFNNSKNTVTITWDTVAHPNLAGFVVYRKDSLQTAIEPQNISGGILVQATSFIDTIIGFDIGEKITFQYQVKSQDNKGDKSGFSWPEYVPVEIINDTDTSDDISPVIVFDSSFVKDSIYFFGDKVFMPFEINDSDDTSWNCSLKVNNETSFTSCSTGSVNFIIDDTLNGTFKVVIKVVDGKMKSVVDSIYLSVGNWHSIVNNGSYAGAPIADSFGNVYVANVKGDLSRYDNKGFLDYTVNSLFYGGNVPFGLEATKLFGHSTSGTIRIVDAASGFINDEFSLIMKDSTFDSISGDTTWYHEQRYSVSLAKTSSGTFLVPSTMNYLNRVGNSIFTVQTNLIIQEYDLNGNVIQEERIDSTVNGGEPKFIPGQKHGFLIWNNALYKINESNLKESFKSSITFSQITVSADGNIVIKTEESDSTVYKFKVYDKDLNEISSYDFSEVINSIDVDAHEIYFWRIFIFGKESVFMQRFLTYLDGSQLISKSSVACISYDGVFLGADNYACFGQTFGAIPYYNGFLTSSNPEGVNGVSSLLTVFDKNGVYRKVD